MGATERNANTASGTSLSTRVHALVLAVGSVSTIALFALPNAASAEGCPNAAFRTGLSLHLPDCRAYEMVTPSGTTNGVEVSTFARSPDGSVVMAVSRGAFAGAQDNLGQDSGANYYSLRRTESGWTTTPLAPPASQYIAKSNGDEFGQSLDTLTTLWEDRGASQSDNSYNIYREGADGSFADVGPLLAPTAPPSIVSGLGSEVNSVLPTGVSDDASHVFFSTNNKAGSWSFDGTQTGFVSLFEYVGTDNTTPMLVGVNSEGSEISQCGTILGGGNQTQELLPGSSHNAISADGDTV